jgi:phenylacetate-CoA ligase
LSWSQTFVRHVGYPLWLQYRRESGILRNLKYFRPLWNAEWEEIRNLKLANLRSILTHAGATSTYYQKLFANVGFDPQAVTQLSDVANLPPLTKDDLNREMDSLLSNRYRKDQLTESHTGGSSGTTLTFYRNQATTEIRRSQDLLFSEQIQVYPGTKRAWVWGAPLDVMQLHTLKSRVRNFLTERAIYFYSFDATESSIHLFLEQLNAYRPDVIFAYPNMLAVMAQYAQDKGLSLRPIRKVVVTAESVHDWQRQLYHDVFGAQTYERYGAREMGTVASEVPGHGGLHLFEPGYYLEVIDGTGRPVPEGSMGELVVTDLHNTAMPLIRYRTGDMVVLDSSPCNCGCTWRRIAKVGGRVLDLVSRPDGSKIAGQAITQIVLSAAVRCRVQVLQIGLNSFVIRHLETETITPESRARLFGHFRDLLGNDVVVGYEGVKELTYDKSGKYRWFINTLNRNGQPAEVQRP